MERNDNLSATRSALISADFNGYIVTGVIDNYLRQVAEAAIRMEGKAVVLQEENVRLSEEIKGHANSLRHEMTQLHGRISQLDDRIDEVVQLIIKTASAQATYEANMTASDENYSRRMRRSDPMGS